MCPPVTSISNFLLSSANSPKSSDRTKARCLDGFLSCASKGAIARIYNALERSLAKLIATSIALSASVDPSCTSRMSSDNVGSMPDKEYTDQSCLVHGQDDFPIAELSDSLNDEGSSDFDLLLVNPQETQQAPLSGSSREIGAIYFRLHCQRIWCCASTGKLERLLLSVTSKQKWSRQPLRQPEANSNTPCIPKAPQL